MDKIIEHESDACMVVVSNFFFSTNIFNFNSLILNFQINNRLMELNQKESALIVHAQDDGKWKRLNNSKYE